MLAFQDCIMLRSAVPPALLQEQRLHEASQNTFVECLQKLNEGVFLLCPHAMPLFRGSNGTFQLIGSRGPKSSQQSPAA